MKKFTQNAAYAVTTATVQLNQANAAVKVMQSEIDKCNRSLSLAKTSWNTAGEAIKKARRLL